jgi:hypothetical protein
MPVYWAGICSNGWTCLIRADTLSGSDSGASYRSGCLRGLTQLEVLGNMVRRAWFFTAIASLVVVLACIGGVSCAGSPGLPYDTRSLGTGLTVIPAEDGSALPSVTVLAERTADYRGEDRYVIYGVSGRFSQVVNSVGEPIAGPGIAALIYADGERSRVLRTVVFRDPGPGAPMPTIEARTVDERLFDLSDGELPRPPRVVVSVAAVHAGVDAGPAGRIDGGLFTGGVAVMDLDGPGPLNVIAFEGARTDAPMEFQEVSADTQGIRATVNGSGHVVSTRDLQGLVRIAEGRAVRLQVDLRGGAVRELTLAPALPPTE